MSQATITLNGDGPTLAYTFDDGQRIEAHVVASKIPQWLGVGGITFNRTIRLSPVLKLKSVEILSTFLAHELRHVWQINRWGWLDYDLMYIPRRIFRGCGDGTGNDIEQSAYDFEHAHSNDFVTAAQFLRDQHLF